MNEWPNTTVADLFYCVNDFDGQNTFYQLWMLPESPELHQICFAQSQSVLVFLEEVTSLSVWETERRSWWFRKDILIPWRFWVSPNFLAGNVSFNILKAMFSCFGGHSKRDDGPLRRFNIRMIPLLTWLKVFFSLYVSRLPLLFRELWNRSKGHSVMERSRAGVGTGHTPSPLEGDTHNGWRLFSSHGNQGTTQSQCLNAVEEAWQGLWTLMIVFGIFFNYSVEWKGRVVWTVCNSGRKRGEK